jgi:hypothetical protein
VRRSLFRAAALWALLLGFYLASSGIDAAPGNRYGGAEPHHLLAAGSLGADGDLDLADDYARRAWQPFADRLEPTAAPFEGRLHEPEGIGFPLVLAPAQRLAGASGAVGLCAALAALAFVLAGFLARIVEPEPWATGGALVAAASVPALAHATAVVPALTAGALLAAATIMAVRIREDGRVRDGIWGGLALAVLPWLGMEFAALGIPVLGAMALWSWERGRGIAGLAAAEVVAVSAITYVRVNEVLYGALLPDAARMGARPADVLSGAWWWAPPAAFALAGAALLARSRRSRVARVVPEHAEAEAATAAALGVCAVAVLVAAVLGSTAAVAAALPLVAVPAAWTLRALRRVGAALVVLTAAFAGWALVAGWAGGAWSG